jgi:hypothetical protein
MIGQTCCGLNPRHESAGHDEATSDDRCRQASPAPIGRDQPNFMAKLGELTGPVMVLIGSIALSIEAAPAHSGLSRCSAELSPNLGDGRAGQAAAVLG